MRPTKLWHWFAIAFLVATALSEPRAAAALSWDLFRFAGSVGGELISGGTGNDTDLLDLEDNPPFHDDSVAGDDDGPNDDVTPGPQPGPPEEVPQAAPEPEGASAPHGCGPEDSCVYGFELPDPDTVIAEAERLHEMTNGALGCLMSDPSTGCFEEGTATRLTGVTNSPPAQSGGGTDSSGRWVPMVDETVST